MSESETGATRPTSVRECLKAIGSGKVAGTSDSLNEQCAKIGQFMDEHPFMGGIIANIILRKYERENGRAGAIDWAKILEWMKNGGLNTLLQIIMSIISVFGV